MSNYYATSEPLYLHLAIIEYHCTVDKTTHTAEHCTICLAMLLRMLTEK